MAFLETYGLKYSLFPLIFISYLIISVFTEKKDETMDLSGLILDFPFGLVSPLEPPQF